MDREMLSEEMLDNVTGGSICFNEDLTTCGRNCNDQYKVNNANAVLQFLKENHMTMSEKSMLSQMVSLGYISAM